jgi:high-affinity nickel-transport protein
MPHKLGELLNWFILRYHSIVIITSLVTAATAAHLATKFDRFSQIGNIIGTSISATFLILLGVMNGWILYKLVRGLRAWVRGDMEVDAAKESDGEELWEKRGGGPMFWILKKLFRLIDQ